VIVSVQLGVQDRQTTTTSSNMGTQQFAEAMNNASASHSPPQPGSTPNPQPGPSPGHPQPGPTTSGQSQCNPSMFWAGMGGYAVAAVEGAVVGIFAVGAGNDDPVAGGLIGGFGGAIVLGELAHATYDVVNSKCL
jgi:hypothetical protein